MSFKSLLILYVMALAVFFVIDMIWLGLVARNFYRDQLGSLLSPKVNWTAAVLFYLLFIFGLLVFVIEPGFSQSLTSVLLKGGLFGLIAYATYDLTNLATLKDWSLKVTVVDLIWGTVLGGTVSLLSVLLGRLVIKT